MCYCQTPSPSHILRACLACALIFSTYGHRTSVPARVELFYDLVRANLTAWKCQFHYYFFFVPTLFFIKKYLRGTTINQILQSNVYISKRYWYIVTARRNERNSYIAQTNPLEYGIHPWNYYCSIGINFRRSLCWSTIWFW